MKTKRKLSDLYQDAKLLEIRRVNNVTVSLYRQNYLEGAEFPPLVVEKDTGRIVSGNHRYEAMCMAFGKDHKAEVVEKAFASERAVLEEFARENLTHGRPMEGFERRVLVDELIKSGATAGEIAEIFNVSVRAVERYGSGTVGVVINGSVKRKPAKRGFEPGRPITEQEYEVHRMTDRGVPITQKVNELMRWLEGDFVTRTPENMALVKRLAFVCADWVKKEVGQNS